MYILVLGFFSSGVISVFFYIWGIIFVFRDMLIRDVMMGNNILYWGSNLDGIGFKE